ncbi:prolipoprotein diacylglyceryl transferase family protein [Nonomuraea sp. NPDC049480]|uniref:prolipoprotein diacylglyceryl transferase family protein n=1 Tax=Nonomuraea sp. NPDC049480 TaxID=3364353 RepID=UPI00379BFD93
MARWGDWFNQELYGSPTTLPWGLEIDQAHGGEPGVLYHPTFLYESWTSIVLFVGALVHLWVTRDEDTEEIVVPASHKGDGGEAAEEKQVVPEK